MTFPYFSSSDRLEPEDLELFNPEFTKITYSLISYFSGPLTLFAYQKNDSNNESFSYPDPWLQNIERVQEKKRPIIVPAESIIYLPIWRESDLIGVAVLEGLDNTFIKKVSMEWLEDRSRILSSEFCLYKRLSIDPVTGLLNIRHLRDELNDNLDMETPFFLSLLEVFPKVQSTEKALQYINNVGYYLNSCLGHLPLHHLGSGVFAYIWHDISEEQALKLGKTLLDLLKRENFVQAHLGLTDFHSDGSKKLIKSDFVLNPDIIIDQAWQALRAACDRGPYALCTYRALSNFENHPLQKPSDSIQRELRSLWQRVNTFCIILLSLDDHASASKKISKRILTLIGTENISVKINGREAFIFLGGADKKKAFAWAKTLREKLKKLSKRTFSMGIAVFPENNFKKSDIPLNARKALLHTKFYGPDTITAFDAVSLNVSGDIYYSEGDLNRAVKEYRMGLVFDSENTNILNSLGEAYAQMNRHKSAVQYFDKALEIEPYNYMALFNLGVTHRMMGNEQQAIESFEKALNLKSSASQEGIDSSIDESKAEYDLLYQLGRLYYNNGRYKKAIKVLSRCVAISDNAETTDSVIRKKIFRGGAYRYLGMAYKELGKNNDAMPLLERAVSYNPRDALTLSLLGELYCMEGQGNEIALSLCVRAVELDDSSMINWYRLGLVRLELGQLKDAEFALQRSLALKRNYVPALYLLGKVNKGLGQLEKAAKIYKKVLRLKPSHSGVRQSLAKLRKDNIRNIKISKTKKNRSK